MAEAHGVEGGYVSTPILKGVAPSEFPISFQDGTFTLNCLINWLHIVIWNATQSGTPTFTHKRISVFTPLVTSLTLIQSGCFVRPCVVVRTCKSILTPVWPVSEDPSTTVSWCSDGRRVCTFSSFSCSSALTWKVNYSVNQWGIHQRTGCIVHSASVHSLVFILVNLRRGLFSSTSMDIQRLVQTPFT